MNLDSIVCRGIRERRLLTLSYGDSERVVEPYIVGDDHAGDRLLSAYQLGGGSASGQTHGWKTFRMDRITHVELTVERFHGARPEYREDDGAFARVICRVEG
jgi:predicted DNA-binding transcriptional regulator YafY